MAVNDQPAAFALVVATDPETEFVYSGETSDGERLRDVLFEMALASNLNWWARQVPASEMLARAVAAANRGRWTELVDLAGPGRLLVSDGEDVTVYSLRTIAGALATWMSSQRKSAEVTVCATVIGDDIGAEVVVRLDETHRTEVALRGAISGPMGRLQDIHLTINDESPVRSWLDGLGGRRRPQVLSSR
jgi:hypothetical protein